MYHHRPSDDWDKKERKMDEADIKAGADDEPEKEKVNVETEEEIPQPPISGLFCILCHDYAVHIYQGNSLCHQCFTKEMADLIKEKRNNK